MMPREWIRLPVQLTPKQHEYLRRRAYEEGRSIADIVRELVEADRVRTGDQLELELVPGDRARAGQR